MQGVYGMKNRVLMQKWIVLIFVGVLLFSVVQEICYGQGRSKIYWTEIGKIRRANLDGSNVTDVLTGLDFPFDIALDTDGFYDVTPDTNKVTTTWASVKIQ